MRPLVRDIASQVAQEYGVELARLLGPERHPALTRLRVEAWRRAMKAGRTSAEVGRVFKRDSSTIRGTVKRAGL